MTLTIAELKAVPAKKLDYSGRLLKEVVMEQWEGKPRSRNTIRDYILTLDPSQDYEEISFLATYYDCPFDMRRSLELALVRVFAVPFSSETLVKSRQFEKFAQKRYDDTRLILAEILESGLESERGRAAIRLMNQIHSRFNISNEEFLYVMTTFIFEPMRWNKRFGWRPLSENERQATFYYWQRLGAMMGIKDIPDSLEALEKFNIEYEAKHFCYSEANRRLGDATINLYLSWFPAILRPALRPAVLTFFDAPMLAAFGFAPPPRWLQSTVELALKTRARLLRLWPAQRYGQLVTTEQHRTYPQGYQLNELGPKH